ncbi:MAG TPA: reverse transcriptase family protein [Rubricoccaceae bacterium]
MQAALWRSAVEWVQREPENRVPVRLLRHFSGERSRAEAYTSFSLRKRRGGTRTISTPGPSLKWLQRSVLQVLTHLFPRHKCAVGFERGQSVVTHARAHARKRWVYCVDIQDFFPSITRARVFGMLQAKPFEASEPVARYLADLVTVDGALPQGGPTSPILANLLCRRLDSRLFRWARERGYAYTRYADDLAFSTNRVDFPEADRQAIDEIIANEGFRVHPEKRKLMPWYGRQLVTGLVVNRGANVPRETTRALRALLFNVETFGWASQLGRKALYDKAADWVLYKERALSAADYEAKVERQRAERLLVRPGAALRKAYSVTTLQRVVRGRIEFVGAVKGHESAVYRRFLDQYLALVKREQAFAAEEEKGRSTFVADPVVAPAPVPVKPGGNYVDFMRLLRKVDSGEATMVDLHHWVEQRAGWSLEADWILRDFGTVDESELKGRLRTLAHALDTHPAKTAEFFRQFGVGRPFRRLLHEPLGMPTDDGRFPFENGESMSAGEVVGACQAALASVPLPNRLHREAARLLRECEAWLEANPGAHPFVSGPLQERLRIFKSEVRFDDEPGLDLWDRLTVGTPNVVMGVDALIKQGGRIEFEGLPPVFHTYTPAAVDGLLRLLHSLVKKAISKAGGGAVQPVRVDATYEQVGQTHQATVVLQANDGPLDIPPGLRSVLRGDTQSALFDLRGLARWTMEVPYRDGTLRAYDVTQNVEVPPVQTDLPGFRHVLTFYQ